MWQTDASNPEGSRGPSRKASYFIVGEGVVSADPGELSLRACSRGALVPVLPHRPARPATAEGLRRRLANAMTSSDAGQSQVPAGFTYLGQFIDHDLTFDVTQVMLGENLDRRELLQGRSPSLDLDSLYGAGPDDPDRPSSTGDGVHLKMGRRRSSVGPDGAKDGFDLPRVGPRARRAAALSPTSETTRTSPSPRRTPRSSASTSGSSTRCRRGVPGRAALHSGRGGESSPLPVDDQDRLPAAHRRSGDRR